MGKIAPFLPEYQPDVIPSLATPEGNGDVEGTTGDAAADAVAEPTWYGMLDVVASWRSLSAWFTWQSPACVGCRRAGGGRSTPGEPPFGYWRRVGLAPGRTLHLVMAGEKTLLIGATDYHLSLLAELPNASAPVVEEAAIAFEEALQREIKPSPEGRGVTGTPEGTRTSPTGVWPSNGYAAEPPACARHCKERTMNPVPERTTPRKARALRLLRLAPLLLVIGLLVTGCAGDNPGAIPPMRFNLELGPDSSPQVMSNGLQILLALTVLSLAPAVLVMLTAFTRIVIVLSFVRNALSVPQVPPNQVIIGLALFLTFFVMAPTWNQLNQEALQPYLRGEIDQQVAYERGIGPVREFLFRQTRERDLALFVEMSGLPRPESRADVPTYVLIPAFIISELKTAFQMGIIIFIPFLIIDMVVASALTSLGMMMLPPSLISLPFKILLFVMVDGWHLIARSLMTSFGPG